MQLWTMFPGWREHKASGEEMLYCEKHIPQQGAKEGMLGTPVPCGKGGAVPGR